MIKIDGIDKKRGAIVEIISYLYDGFLTLGIVFILIALWEFGSLKLGNFLLPNPQIVFERAIKLLSNIKNNQMDITFFRFLYGVIISLILGISLGIIAGSFKTSKAILSPIIKLLLSMPPIIWIVMALFWFGFGNKSTIFTIVITTTPLAFFNFMMGMMTVSNELKEFFDVYKLGIMKKIRFLYIPHLTGYFIACISICISMAIKITIMAELLGANNGIGAKIADSRMFLDTTNVFAFVCIILSFSALIEYLIIKPLEILLMPWRK